MTVCPLCRFRTASYRERPREESHLGCRRAVCIFHAWTDRRHRDYNRPGNVTWIRRWQDRNPRERKFWWPPPPRPTYTYTMTGTFGGTTNASTINHLFNQTPFITTSGTTATTIQIQGWR